MTRRIAPLLVLALIATLAVVLPGCGTVKTTGTARTATEQLLLTNAWDSALQQVDFRPLTGVPVYLDTTNVTAVDQGWVVSSLRQAMLTQGVLLRSKAEQAQWVVEARVGVYGTNSYDWLVGISQTTIPPTLTGIPSGTIPEIPLVKKSDQQAISKLALFAYDRASGQLVWTSGTQLATSSAKDVYLGGIGPVQSGSVRGGGKGKIGIQLPMASDPEPSSPGTAGREGVPFSKSPLAVPALATDRESFAP